MALLVTGHVATDVPYPFGRTGLYSIVLATELIAGAAATLRRRKEAAWRVASVVLTLALGAGALRYGSELTTDYFFHWRFDSGTAGVRTAVGVRGGRGLHTPGVRGVLMRKKQDQTDSRGSALGGRSSLATPALAPPVLP